MKKSTAFAKKNVFGVDSDSDDATASSTTPSLHTGASKKNKSKNKNKKGPSLNPPPPLSKPKRPNTAAPISQYGDLSSALESKKHKDAAEQLDPSIYDYDGVYDSLQPTKKDDEDESSGPGPRRAKYMDSLLASAAVRKRDALIAEEKRIARERAAEGDEFADKESFVTEAYKRQQEENQRLEEQERLQEEEAARKNKGAGMAAFYKQLLDRGDQRHTEIMKAAEDRAKAGPEAGKKAEEEENEDEKEKSATERAREINAKGGRIEINEDGEVVDKRQLLKGGLNLGVPQIKKQRREEEEARRQQSSGSDPSGRDNSAQSRFVGAGGGKNAMRERQSRMIEAQLEQSLKRSLEDEEEERKKVEHAAKSRKTESDVSSAKERYLARKRAAEEQKKTAVVVVAASD